MQIREVKQQLHFSLRPGDSMGNLMLVMLIQENAISAATISADKHELFDVYEKEFNAGDNRPDLLINEIAFFLSNAGLNKKNFSYISIQLLNRQFTLLPKEFAAGDLKSLITLNTGLSNPENIRQNHINNEITIAFPVESELQNFIERTFNTAHVKHAAANTIELFLKLPAFINEQVFLIVHPNLIELAVKDKRQLKFYNVFKWDAAEDILYFVLFTMEQCAVSADSARLMIAANLPANDQLFLLLKKHVRHVQFFVSKLIDKPVDNLPNHYFFTILNDHLCE
jgi:hypothetical protein